MLTRLYVSHDLGLHYHFSTGAWAAHALLFRGSLLSQQSSVSAAKLRKHSYAAKVLMAISL